MCSFGCVPLLPSLLTLSICLLKPASVNFDSVVQIHPALEGKKSKNSQASSCVAFSTRDLYVGMQSLAASRAAASATLSGASSPNAEGSASPQSVSPPSAPVLSDLAYYSLRLAGEPEGTSLRPGVAVDIHYIASGAKGGGLKVRLLPEQHVSSAFAGIRNRTFLGLKDLVSIREIHVRLPPA